MNTKERADRISGRTGLVALLGHPVAHSLSPRLHNVAFAARGLDMAYLAFDVQQERLGEAVAGLLAMGARGANVTVPYKEAVLAFTDRLDPLAEQVGAVNTLVREEGRFAGYNTDVYGFLMSVEHTWGRAPTGCSTRTWLAASAISIWLTPAPMSRGYATPTPTKAFA